MKLFKNFFWLIFTFIWSQFYVILLLILLALFVLFVIASVKIAKTNMEDYMMLLRALASFAVPALASLFIGIIGLKKLLGHSTFIGKLTGLVLIPAAAFVAYKGYSLFWNDFSLAFAAIKSTLTGMWKS